MNFVCRHLHRMLGMERVEIALNIQSVDWVIGAFMMIPRQAYEVVGAGCTTFVLVRIWICARECIWQDILLFIFREAEIEYEGTRSARYSLKYACVFLKSIAVLKKKFGISWVSRIVRIRMIS